MKTKKWQLQDAKNKFSEIVRRAATEGPQFVSKHGKEEVVVLSMKDYKKLEGPENSLVDFFRHSPLASVELDVERDKTPSRDVAL